MQTNSQLLSNSFWLRLCTGMLTGMGNGSVFGACVMCFLGRGKFNDWGGWMGLAYDPYTFSGFVDWSMITFGLAYVFILGLAFRRQLTLEKTA